MIKWISVFEKKPPQNKRVLVYSIYKTIEIMEQDLADGYWRPNNIMAIPTFVIYWMPLPDPPSIKK